MPTELTGSSTKTTGSLEPAKRPPQNRRGERPAAIAEKSIRFVPSSLSEAEPDLWVGSGLRLQLRARHYYR